MHKNHLFTILLIILLSPLVPSISPLGVQASESSSVSVASPDVVGSGASEEENIDSMDVHPINRWTETNNGYTATVVNGLLNLTDVGDGSADSSEWRRDLRDLEGTVEVRFRVVSNATSTDSSDSLNIALMNGAGTSNTRVIFALFQIDASGPTVTRFQYFNVDGSIDTKELFGDERAFANTWYVFRMDYDILLSTLRVRLFFDNGSKVFDINEFDVTSNRLKIFTETDLLLSVRSGSTTNNLKRTDLFDYVKAPFKEREWEQIDTPVDADYLQDEWYIARARDDIDELSVYSLTVPFLDSVSGVLQVELPNRDHATFTTAGDKISVTFQVFAVDADDGDLHEAASIQIQTYEEAGGDNSDLEFELDNANVITLGAITDTSADVTTCAFSIATINDRSTITVQFQVDFDGLDIQRYYGEVDVSDVATDPSQEFLFKVIYICDLDKNTEIMAGITRFNLLTKDIFSDIGGFLDDIIGEVQGAGSDLFSTIFRWLASVLITAWESIIGGLQGAFEIALGLVETAVGLVEDAIDALGLILDDIVAALGELAADIIDLLVAGITDIVDALLAALELAIDALADILFALWDALSFPDVLAVVSALLVGFTQLILGGPQLITDLGELVNNIFIISIWGGLLIFLGLPIVIAPTPGEWILKVMEFFMFDLSFGISILGFQVRAPAGLAWIVFVIGSGVLSGAIIGGFF